MLVGNIATLVATRVPPKHKEMQMAMIFHMLQYERPMIEYPHMKELSQLLNVHG